MGSSSSKSKTSQTYDTTIINKSDIDILNKSINEFIANTIVKQASNCATSVYQIQTIDLSNMDIEGDLVIGEIEQDQSAVVTFDCVQVTSFANELANNLVDRYISEIKNNFSTEVMDKLIAAADASASSSFGATGNTNTNSKVNIDYEFTSITDISKSIQNVIQNSIVNNLNLEDIQDCIATVKANQTVTTAGTKVGGNVTIGVIRQKQASELVASCLQQKDNANKITTQIIKTLDLTVDESNSVKKTTETDAQAQSKSENKGVGEAVGDMFRGVGDMLSNIFGMSSGFTLVIILGIIAFVIISIFYVYFTRGSGESDLDSFSSPGSDYSPVSDYS